jgi:hydroxyacylglutathione hydrolase
MNLVALPAFTDNYLWMLHDGRQAIVVDPGDAAPVVQALDARGLTLAGIVVTHHHGDHIGGIDALRARLEGPVWGPAREPIPAPFVPMRDGDSVDLLGTRFEVIDVPGHTAGHIAYFGQPTGEAPILFCGDTLFSGGCGRLFEGTAAQMHASLSRLAALPGDTRVCCAHEYTLSNLRFANAVEPGNAALNAYTFRCEDLRRQGLPTLPSTVATERAVNPFLRTGEPEVCASALEQGAAGKDPVSVLAALREWKNGFR